MSRPRTAGVLTVSDGWVVDWITRDRLVRALAAAPADLAGVAALAGPLAPGASYRTQAERAALEGTAITTEAVPGPVCGAVLVRDGAESAGGTSVEVSGPVMAVRGTHAHDPTADPGPLQPAVDVARSPFPVRPMVVFLTVDGAPDAWVVDLVDGLLEADVEARIASAEMPPGPHLTRPCLASAESIGALRPDTVVTVDEGARHVAEGWCPTKRGTTLVDVVDSLGAGFELVDWQIERASGRVRAQVGPGIGVADLGALVSRLVAGPQPVAPTP